MPARIRFVSAEPLLEDLGTLDLAGIHWVIVGGESGPKPQSSKQKYRITAAGRTLVEQHG